MNDSPSVSQCADDEEAAWYSLLQLSRALRDSGQDEQFVKTALDAFQQRPHRAEPLHDLARYYLGKSLGDIAIVYAEAGMALPLPEQDHPGVEEDVYRFRLKEAFVIAASYSKDADEKERGRVICNWLSMDNALPHHTRALARQNSRWYAEPANLLFPSIRFNALTVTAPEGFKPGNISLVRLDDGFVALVRAVNWDLLDSGYFDRHGDTSFRQRVLLLRLDRNLGIIGTDEVLPPDDLPSPRHFDSLGFEDPRPVVWRNELWCLSSLRQLNEEGRAEMVLARIAKGPQGHCVFSDWRILASGRPPQWEKNWMPQVVGDELRFIYSVDPTRVLSESGEVLWDQDAPIAVENFRGGSQAIPFDGGWLMLIHEWELAGARRNYFHRFIWLDSGNRLARVSRRFFFFKPGYEFVAGLAWHVSNDCLVASFGIDEHSPTLAIIEARDIRMALLDIEEHERASERACQAGRAALDALCTPSMARALPESGPHAPRSTFHPAAGGDSDGRTMDYLGAPRARLITAFGTVLYVDVPSGHLRHGPVESSPANAVFVAEPGWGQPHRMGRLMQDKGDSLEPIACLSERCQIVSSMESGRDSAVGTPLELVPLERGLIAFAAEGLFLMADPNGLVALAAQVCSTWECFLASEDWCTDGAGNEQLPAIANANFDTRRIQTYLVHPMIRKRANPKSTATKVLIYGYPQWSHGRVYYDLCKQLHRRGYIVDILNWQVNHANYIGDLIPFYDLFMTALDGVRTLTDAYGIPYDRIIALSHHELDIRMLIEQKGVEVFDKFANYGVVSEFLYSASLMRGVPRTPMVATLGINFSDFYAEIPERLATVGYAGSMSTKTFDVEWKRGEIAEAAVREAGLAFKVAGTTGNQISFHDMPDFYRTVDAVLATSVSEGAGLPVMEAAAAGRLVISTPVGHFALKAYQGGGIIAPIEAEKFKAFTVATLKYYRENPAAYRDKCHAIQEAARKFDWQYTIGEWIDLIDCARTRSDPSTRIAAIAEHHTKQVEVSGSPPFLKSADAVTETQQIFSRIYHQRGFGGTESRSGPGSSIAKTAKLRAELPEVFQSLGIKRLVDAPCGDMNWMRRLKYDFDFFVGVDVVKDLIESLRGQFSSEKMHFQQGDICEQILPAADAIFCRDCLVHLPLSKISDAVRLFKKSGAKFLLTTTFPDKDNRDLLMGGWRPLNLQADPFWWPAPVRLVREDFPEDTDPWDKNKSIGVWDLTSLPG